MKPESEFVALTGVTVHTEHLGIFGTRLPALRPRSVVVAAHLLECVMLLADRTDALLVLVGGTHVVGVEHAEVELLWSF